MTTLDVSNSAPLVRAFPHDGHASGSESRQAESKQAGPGMNEQELAELLGAFNAATNKLHVAHESLRAEVVRLQGELRQANEQLERSRRLAALGEMAAGIAHEVRNPLGSIRLYAKMLSDDLRDRPGERTLAEKIAAATRGLDAVVVDVLAFAREMRLNVSPWTATELLTRALEECLGCDRIEAPDRAHVSVVRHDQQDGAKAATEVLCDAAHMHRALVNILRNALQAMRDHASAPAMIELDVRRRVLPDERGNDRGYIALVVRDHGPGLSPQVMQRMFNPFFTTRATGTGLGLAIVHRIMDAHAGRVTVSNVASGQGAIVELLLPDSLMNVSQRDATYPMQTLATDGPPGMDVRTS